MKRITICSVIVILSLLSFTHAEAAEPQRTPPPTQIVLLDPRFDQFVPTNAAVEVVADGLAWVEGPVWNRMKSALLFSDIPNNAVMQWKEGSGISQFLKPSGYTGSAPFTGREPGSKGLTFDAQGRLVLCEHGDRRIARLEADGRKTTLADRYQGKRLNSSNDAVFRSNGDLYFTDPPFGLPKSFDDPQKELDFQGMYRLSATGELSALLKDVKAPNGIAFSPDEKIAYVSNADKENPVWMAYSVKDDGTFTNTSSSLRRTMAILQETKPGLRTCDLSTMAERYLQGWPIHLPNKE